MTAARSRVVVDTDTGIDDAMALVWLATHHAVEIVAVGSTHGNCRADQAAVNALRVLEACGTSGVPVAVGEAGPVAGAASFATEVHGHDGLGDAGLPGPVSHPSGEGAVDQLLRLGSEQPGELDLLALGPLTNLAVALTRDPEALSRYRSLVVMGGVGARRPPAAADPTGGVGDPNTGHDPVAAAAVYAARPCTMVGVDVTLGIRMTARDLARVTLAGTPHGRLLARALPQYVRFHAARFGPATCCAHDVMAAAVLTDPDVVTASAVGTVRVMGSGPGARAVLDPSRAGTSSAVGAMDGRAVLDRLIASLDRQRGQG